MIVENAKQIGQEGKHLKLLLRSETSDELIDAICFGKGNRYSEVTLGSSIKCVGIVDINIWKNRQSVQLRLKDFTL